MPYEIKQQYPDLKHKTPLEIYFNGKRRGIIEAVYKGNKISKYSVYLVTEFGSIAPDFRERYFKTLKEALNAVHHFFWAHGYAEI